MYSVIIFAALSASEPSYRHVEKVHAHKTVSRGHGPVAVSSGGCTGNYSAGCVGSFGPVAAGCSGGYGRSVTRSRGFTNPVYSFPAQYQTMPKECTGPDCPPKKSHHD